MSERNELLAKAEVIKNETAKKANSHTRIGGMFEDIIKFIPDDRNEIGYVEDVVGHDIGSDETTKPGLYRYAKYNDNNDSEYVENSGFLLVTLENSIENKTNYKQYLFIGKGTYIRETGFINPVNVGVAAFAGIEWKPFSCFDLGVVNESDLDKCIASGNYSYQIGKGMAASIESGLLSVTTYHEFKSLTEEILHVYQTRTLSAASGERVFKRSGYRDIYSESPDVIWSNWVLITADLGVISESALDDVKEAGIYTFSIEHESGGGVLKETYIERGILETSTYLSLLGLGTYNKIYQKKTSNGKTQVRYYPNVVGGIVQESWSEWVGSNVDAELTPSTSGLSPVLKNNEGKLYYEKGSGGTESLKKLSWSGDVVRGIEVLEMSAIRSGDVVLAYNTRDIPFFILRVDMGNGSVSNIKYYANWPVREEYQDGLYKEDSSVFTAGFKDNVLYVSDNSVMIKSPDEDKLVSLSGGGSGSVLIGNITPITESSTKADIVSALLPSTFDELFTAIQNKNEIVSFMETGSDRTIISTSSCMQPVSTSKVIALEYIRGGIVYQKFIQKSNDDIYCSLSSAIVLNDIKPEGFMDVEIKFIKESTNQSAYPFETPALAFRVNNYVEDGYLILYTKKRTSGKVKTKSYNDESRKVYTNKRKESRYVPRGLKRNALILKDKVGNGAFQTTSDQLLLKIEKEDVGKWIPIPDRMYINIITIKLENNHNLYSIFGVNNSFDFDMKTHLFDKSGSMHKNVAFRYVKLNMNFINGGHYEGKKDTNLSDPVIIQGGNMAYAKVIFSVPKNKDQFVVSVQPR